MKDILSKEDQDRIRTCQAMVTNQSFTVMGLVDLLTRVPSLVQSLTQKLQVQYERTETLRMQVKDLEERLAATVGQRTVIDRQAALITRQNDNIKVLQRNAEVLLEQLDGLRLFTARQDAERQALEDDQQRQMVALRSQFSAQVGETFLEFVTRLGQERAAAQDELRGLQDRKQLVAEIAKTGLALSAEVTKNARLTTQLMEVKARVEAAERCAAKAERTADAKLKARVDELEGLLAQVNDRDCLSIAAVVHDAYETAKEKGWHDPEDEHEVTVVETRQALCREGLRALQLCRIAEMIRKGEKPQMADYLRMFNEPAYLLTAADTRLVSDLMLVITEVGEAIEDVLAGQLDELCDDKGKPVGLPSELADVVIRVAHICGHRGIDLAGAVRRKLHFNKTRPRKHGKKA